MIVGDVWVFTLRLFKLLLEGILTSCEVID